MQQHTVEKKQALAVWRLSWAGAAAGVGGTLAAQQLTKE